MPRSIIKVLPHPIRWGQVLGRHASYEVEPGPRIVILFLLPVAGHQIPRFNIEPLASGVPWGYPQILILILTTCWIAGTWRCDLFRLENSSWEVTKRNCRMTWMKNQH